MAEALSAVRGVGEPSIQGGLLESMKVLQNCERRR
jgi:hypothetical protein